MNIFDQHHFTSSTSQYFSHSHFSYKTDKNQGELANFHWKAFPLLPMSRLNLFTAEAATPLIPTIIFNNLMRLLFSSLTHHLIIRAGLLRRIEASTLQISLYKTAYRYYIIKRCAYNIIVIQILAFT